jgi:hypothetical protein
MLSLNKKSLLYVAVVFVVGCAFTPASFNEANIDKLRIGMPSTEVRSIFGAPSEVRTAVCGGNTAGGTWICETWKYPTFNAYITNDFVFNVKDDGKFLNNWNVRR